MCGEHPPSSEDNNEAAGSSPRVRGTQSIRTKFLNRSWFIPACAGNTSEKLLISNYTTVHPRVCGEHYSNHISASIMDGSSPRVRGTRNNPSAYNKPSRFIPACAGNTRQAALIAEIDAVHPRVCGEHTTRFLLINGADGSSPRVRGTQ